MWKKCFIMLILCESKVLNYQKLYTSLTSKFEKILLKYCSFDFNLNLLNFYCKTFLFLVLQLNDTYMGLDNINQVFEGVETVSSKLDSGLTIAVPLLDSDAWMPVMVQINNLSFENILNRYFIFTKLF